MSTYHNQEGKFEESRETELLDALYWMHIQYCAKGGHLFMSAGERSSAILEDTGYIETDGTGRVLKDNGDSYVQNNNKIVDKP